MRQWHVPAYLMCDKHLLGEHVEHHMFKASITSGKSVQGFISDQLLVPGTVTFRHTALAIEMEKRGMVHTSPIGLFEPVSDARVTNGLVANNMRELARRCSDCCARMERDYPHVVKGVPKGGDYYSELDAGSGRIGVFISGKLVGEAPNKVKAIQLMERTRKKMRADGTIWD